MMKKLKNYIYLFILLLFNFMLIPVKIYAQSVYPSYDNLYLYHYIYYYIHDYSNRYFKKIDFLRLYSYIKIIKFALYLQKLRSLDNINYFGLYHV